MARINVEDQKKVIFDLNAIKPFEEEMTFYYDESGNCRKFSLTDTGFNNIDALKSDFVLAGVAHEGRSFYIDVPTLYSALDYREGQKELKFKHLFHNSKDFLSFIGSKRATGFLKWLSKSGLYIHYSALNNLYYSLVDLVDSLLETHPQIIMYMWDIKNAFYDFVIEHQDEVIAILINNTYPDVKYVSDFCNEICSLIREYNDDSEYYPGFFLELLRQMLKTAGKLDKLIFVQDNEEFILIEEYYILYTNRCKIFSKSHHIFDEEMTVQKQMSNLELYEHGLRLNNWQFVKSHENIYVQVSDLMAGLLRKLFVFLDENPLINIVSISMNLNDDQLNNFILLWMLISKSDEKSPLFINNVNSRKNIQERMFKLKLLSVSNNELMREVENYEL
ncbi:DUF3800 domain-containing protein [Anaerococcus lactolyticus]|uniref:DUF3800 domain-containing protein n=1 Tax=Anaerococcus lactolyticus S7-1-13 TaxID=1284686 RepID=A0A095X2X2_9FIRM|nr:DUF3800 domain-containing protein [Anaerococcus lactolyticus]KGF04395.1 hypothetical protein HMPREF1630_04275 [Anaerococcus lactolyticus S7-1-13]